MTVKYDPHAYADLLVEALPGVITSEKENERTLRIVERLIKKGRRSPEESRLLDLLTTLIEAFEAKAYPMGQVSNPLVALRELMREHDLRQTDMVDIFGSQGVVSQVLNGKREISKAQARKTFGTVSLADRRFYLMRQSAILSSNSFLVHLLQTEAVA